MNKEEFVYKDYIPANARVIIDYTKHDRVGFSYPIEWSYRKAVWHRAYQTVLSWWLMLHMFIFIRFSVLIFIGIIIFILYTAIFPFSIIQEKGIFTYNFLNIGLPYICAFFYLFGIPALITLFLSMNKERLSKYIPKMGFFAARVIGSGKEIVFDTKDIFENKCIIPIFSNVYLDYKTEGDFEKYLEKIEIMEIPFKYKRYSFWLPFKKITENNDYKFRACFYFSNKPIDGRMEVQFI